MAVDLGDLVEPLQREVTTLGAEIVGTEEEYLGHLADAFWVARLRGAFPGYELDETDIVPISGTEDLPRELQQLIVLFAGYRIIRRELWRAQTLFRAQAGPVEFETQQSAQVLREVLKVLEDEIKTVLETVTPSAYATTVAYFDSVIASTYSIGSGETWFVR